MSEAAWRALSSAWWQPSSVHRGWAVPRRSLFVRTKPQSWTLLSRKSVYFLEVAWAATSDLISFVTKPNLGLLAWVQENNLLTLDDGKVKYSVYCKASNMVPSKENGQLMLKRPGLLIVFRKEVLKIVWWRWLWGTWSTCAKFSDLLLVGSRLMFLEYQSSTFWFQLSEVPMLVVSTQTSSLGGGFSIDKATQNIIYNPQGGTKCPWFYFMAKLLLCCLPWLFSFVSHLSD